MIASGGGLSEVYEHDGPCGSAKTNSPTLASAVESAIQINTLASVLTRVHVATVHLTGVEFTPDSVRTENRNNGVLVT